MSRHNKVNPDHYTTAGRLSQDDLARERRKQSESPMGFNRKSAKKAAPPWMANDQTNAGGGDNGGNDDDDDLNIGTTAEDDDEAQYDDEDERGGAEAQAEAPQGRPSAS